MMVVCLENKKTKDGEGSSRAMKVIENVSEEVADEVTEELIEEVGEGNEEDETARAKLCGSRAALYQLAEAGLWWDSFEEEPNFELVDDFDSHLSLCEDQDDIGSLQPDLK